MILLLKGKLCDYNIQSKVFKQMIFNIALFLTKQITVQHTHLQRFDIHLKWLSFGCYTVTK